MSEPTTMRVSESTSAMGGFARTQATVLVVAASGALFMPGTSSAGVGIVEDAVVLDADATGSGTSILTNEAVTPDATRSALTELHRLSGLTWDQLSRMFGVSRRSIHFWASGKAMSSENEEHLHRVLAIARGAQRPADSLRVALLSVVHGSQVLELLVEHRYDEALAAVGVGSERRMPPRTALAEPAADARRPLAPDFRVAAEYVHAEQPVSRSRPARTARNKSRDDT